MTKSIPGRDWYSDELLAAYLRPLHAVSFAVYVRWDEVNWTDETTHVLAVNGVESYDPVGRRYQPAEVNITLDNSDGRYDVDNTASPVYAYLTHGGQKVRIDAGYGGYRITVCTVIADRVTPDEAAKTATMRARDVTDGLRTKVNYGPGTSVALDDVLRSYLSNAGLVDGTDFVLDDAETTAQYAYARDVDLMDEAALVCIAENGRLYVDGDGVIRFMNKTNHQAALAQSTMTIRRSELVYRMERQRARENPTNRLVATYTDRETAGTTEVVYTQTKPLVVPPASASVDSVSGLTVYTPGTITFKVKAYADKTQQVPMTVPTVDTITASGVTVHAGAWSPPMTTYSDDLWYVVTWADSEGTFVFSNMKASPVSVTALILKAKPDRPVAEYSVVVDDAESQTRYGLVSERRIPGTYLPDTTTARQRLTEHLFAISGLSATVDITDIDGLPWVHAQDAIFVVDDQYADTFYWLQVVKHTWVITPESYTSELRTVPGFPKSQWFLADSPLSPTESLASATYTKSSLWGTMTWGQTGQWA